MWVLWRTDQGGGFVAKPGQHHSYVKDLRKAQKFPTREAAVRASCVDNEVAVRVSDIIDR